MKRSHYTAILALTVTTVLSGCGTGLGTANVNDGAGDAPIRSVNQNPGWVVFNAPDRFANIGFACNGTVGMYEPRNADNTTSRILQVVKDDPNCPGNPK